MKLTSLLQKVLDNVQTNVSISFWLEGDQYTITLKPSSRIDYEDIAPNYSVSVQDRYQSAEIVELWAPKACHLLYIDRLADRWFYIDVRREGQPIRLYGRSKLFFGK